MQKRNRKLKIIDREDERRRKKEVEMQVIKRNGVKSMVIRDKIGNRIIKLSYNLQLNDATIHEIVDSTLCKLQDGISTQHIDKILAEVLSQKGKSDSTLQTIAARVETSNLHKDTIKRFSTVFEMIHDDKNIENDDERSFVRAFQDELDSAIISNRDYDIPYDRLIEMEKNILYKINDKIVERPSHQFMRQAIYDANPRTIDEVHKLYTELSVAAQTLST